MSAPWKHNQTTLDKVEGRVVDWLDQLNIEEHLGDLKDQITSSDHLETLREKVPGVTPTASSHKLRNFALLLVVGAGVGAVLVARGKAARNTVVPPPYAAPSPVPASTNATKA